MLEVEFINLLQLGVVKRVPVCSINCRNLGYARPLQIDQQYYLI